MNINLTCPINTLGYGVVSTNIALSLERLGNTPSLWTIGNPEIEGDDNVRLIRNMLSRTAFYDNTSPSLRIYHQFDLAQHVSKGIHCSFPIFELDTFTDREKHHLQSQDLIFVASEWAKSVIVQNGITKPVVVVPFGVDKQTFFGGINQSPKTVFLNVGKWEIRKGHDVLVEAFNKAFSASDEVELVMLCQNPVVRQNGEKYNSDWNKLYLSSTLGQAGKIRLLPRLKSHSQVADVMRQADCGVFPARAEGWNLELAEMLAMGKHCIATNYSAHTQYCTPKNTRMVHTDTLSPAYDGVWFHGQGNWAEFGEAQVEQLVKEMRDIHRMKQCGELGVNEEGKKTFGEMTWQRTVELITSGLSQYAQP